MPGSKNLVNGGQNMNMNNESEGMKEGEKEEETETAKKITLAKSGSEPKLGKEEVDDDDIEIDYL